MLPMKSFWLGFLGPFDSLFSTLMCLPLTSVPFSSATAVEADASSSICTKLFQWKKH